MLALTLWQPWAWAIMHLPADIAKPVENRDWKPPTQVIGTRIALHGGKAWDGGALDSIERATRIRRNYLDAVTTLGATRRQGILGTVRLVGVVEERRGRLELVAGDWGDVSRERCAPWFIGRYGWLFDERRVLEVPIPCRGLQKLWKVPDEVASLVIAKGA